MSMAEPILSYDIISVVLSFIEADGSQKSLYQCSLVNKEFNYEASKLLYAHITVHKNWAHAFNLKDRGLPEAKSGWYSALLPRYAPFVKHLRISGYLSDIPPPKNHFPDALQTAIKAFTNLCSVRFTTSACYKDLFTQPLKLLQECSSLRKVTVGGIWLDESRVPLLVELKGLQSITIISPSRAMLDHLPRWLDQLVNDLIELHLLDNCGSITPGVLRAFIPSLKYIRSFSMGLSYSLTDEDLFEMLSRLPYLEDLAVYYYYQQKVPAKFPPLRRLRSLSVALKNHPTTREMSESLSKWIRKTISSTSIESLCIREERWGWEGRVLNFDSLVYHLTAKHAETLKVLDMPFMFISVDCLKVLFTKCTNLEALHFCSGKNLLAQFQEMGHGLPKLHTAGMMIQHIKDVGKEITDEQATSIFNSVPSLKRLRVNSKRCKGSWITNENGELVMKVEMDDAKIGWCDTSLLYSFV